MSENQCEWEIIDENWDETPRKWDDVCPLIIEVISKHGRASPEETLTEYEKLDKRKKRKLLRLILYYRGLTFEQQREVRDDITVTTKDMQMLIEHYNKWKKYKKMKVKVENIKVKEE